MSVPLSGNLKEVALPSLFHFLKIQRKTGILTVRHGAFSKSLHFQKGDVLFATSNYPDDYLGEILLKSGKINFKQYEVAEEELKSTGKTQGAVLVGQGYIKPKDLFDTLVLQMKGIALSLFSWDDAPYSFKETPIAGEASIGITIDPDEMVQNGLARIIDWTRLVSLLPPLHSVLKKNPVQSSFKRSSDSDWVWNLIDDERSVRDILTLSSTKVLSCAQNLNVLIITEMLIPSLHGLKKNEESKERAAERRRHPRMEADISWEQTSKEDRFKKIRGLYAEITTQNYYQMLHIFPSVGKDGIKRAYFKMVKRYHPDRYRGSEFLEIIKEIECIFIHITRAYDTLSVSDLRNDYDQLLAEPRWQQPTEAQSAQDCFYRAEVALSENDLKSAVYFLEEAIRLAPESPEKALMYLRYGQVFSLVPGKLREAVDAFHKSASLDSSKAAPHVELGLAYVKTGLVDRAIAAFQDAIKRDSGNKTARAELAKLDKM